VNTTYLRDKGHSTPIASQLALTTSQLSPRGHFTLASIQIRKKDNFILITSQLWFKGHFALITTQMRTEDHFTLATIANCGRRVIQTRLLHCGFRGMPGGIRVTHYMSTAG